MLLDVLIPKGIERSQFPEIDGMNDDEDQELTDELKRKEKEESGREWDFNSGTSEEKSELYTDEWSEEEKQLLKEEREGEDDWWFS